VALLSLVGAVLAAAGPAVGLRGVGAEVVRVVRTGVCIAAGDVCRPSDAAAQGLSPCTVSERRRSGSASVTVFSIHIGEDHSWAVAQRSDGSVVVTRTDGDDAGVAGGLGLDAGPLRLGVGADYLFTVAAGTGWEFPDAKTAGRFLAGLRGGSAFDSRRWPPAWRSGDGGMAAKVEAGLGVRLGGADGLKAGVGGIEASTRAAAGVRLGRGRTTLYFRTETPVEAWAGVGYSTTVAGVGPAMVEYTRDANGPRELAFRAARPGRSAGEVVETVARLDLRDPTNRAVAARLLHRRAPWPPSVFEDLRAVIRHTVAVGNVERSVYAVTNESRRLELDGRLGLELGMEIERERENRRLIEATAWTGGGRARQREDCMPARA
jgi:hypothetical protein